MSLIERTILKHIEVNPDGVIYVKEYNEILKDGVVISSIPHRTQLLPGAEVPFEYPIVKDAVATHWKPQVIEAFKKKQEALNKRG